jgi:hypothetical protein
MKRTALLTTILLAVALAAAACVGGGDDSAAATAAARPASGMDGEAPMTTMAPTTTMAAATTTVPRPSGGDGDEGEAAEVNAQVIAAQVDPADLGRLIVFTATIQVEVDDVIAAGEQAQAAVAGLGGMLFGQETTTGERPRSTLTIKVPPENFREALQRLAGIGKLVGQTVFADDVTERVVDLQSQITTAEASVERLRTFLEEATDLEDVATLEAELLRRETDLEVLRGRLRTLEGQVALATIVLTLQEPREPEPAPALELVVTAYEGHDGGSGCPGVDSATVDEADEITVCYEVVNTGDTPLDEIDLRDDALDVEFEDLIVVDGDPAAPLAPEARLLFAFEAVAEPSTYSIPVVTATALDPDGEPMRIRVETTVEQVDLRVVEDDSLPGFGDAMAAAWRGLQRVWGVIVVAAGGLVPFLWVPALLAGLWWLARRRTRGGPTTPPEGGGNPNGTPAA